jgi:hypothetical protein
LNIAENEMSIEYLKVGVVALTLAGVCLVSIVRPESVAPIERIANNVVSGLLGAIGASAAAGTAAAGAAAAGTVPPKGAKTKAKEIEIDT